MTGRRFAEDTTVPPGRSQGEVKDLIKRAGADQIAIFESSERSAVAFTLAGRQYRIEVPVPTGPKAAQEERRAWRLMLLLVKAKMEAVREGATTIEREFLSDMVMPNGQTVGNWARTEMALAYKSGQMPASLMLEGPRP